MEKTLQAQYNLIKEGKGDKAYFLKSAFRQFPDMLSQINSFSDTVTILKNRGIISEQIGGLVTTGKKQDWHAIFNENINKLKENTGDFFVVEKPNGYAVKYFSSYDEALAYVNQVDPEGMIDLNIRQIEDSQDTELARRGDEYTQGMEDLHALPNKGKLKEDNLGHNEEWSLQPEGRFWILTYRTIDGKKEKVFQSEEEAKTWIKSNLSENVNSLNESKEAKAIEKETTKEVTDMATRGYDYKDEKNYDNVFGEEFLKGYYTEMKDPKNADKHVDELRAIVAKNLAKDISHYVKDGQFGVKGIGYQTEAPGLGTPKEPKGKFKSSGYGDLKESVLRSQIQLLVKEILTEAEEPPKAALTASEKLYDKLGSVKKAIDALPEKYKEYKKALEAHLNFKFRD